MHITVESGLIARLNAIYRMPTGHIRIHINTSPGYGWALEASEDLIHWDYALGTASGFGLYVDETSPLRPRRFFRLHEQVGRIRR